MKKLLIFVSIILSFATTGLLAQTFTVPALAPSAPAASTPAPSASGKKTSKHKHHRGKHHKKKPSGT